MINQTITEHLDHTKNQTWKLVDDDHNHYNTEDHKYYLAQNVRIDDNHPYVDLDEMNRTQPNSVKEHHMLSRSYRRAATIPLNFRFVKISRK